MKAKPAQQIPLEFGVRHAHGREDFLIGSANRDAVAWIDRWPDWSGAPLLIISGPAACGKTHLAAVWREKADGVFVNPAALVQETAHAIAGKGKYLVLDGIDPWLGDFQAETTLFHLYNLLREERRSMLLTMRMSPAQTDFVIPDLASRLRAAPLALIQPPDDALLASVLIKQFSDRQLRVEEDVIHYLIPRMDRSFAAARDIVERADHMAMARKRAISVPLMREILAGLQE